VPHDEAGEVGRGSGVGHALGSPALRSARASRLPDAMPSVVARPSALFGPGSFATLMSSPGPLDALIVDRGREVGEAVPRTLDALERLLDAGHSLVVRRAERRLESARAIASEVERALSAPARVQLFVTPTSHTSFGWHYDADDVCIVQTQGTKDYYLRRNTVDPGATAGPPFDFGRFVEESAPIAVCSLAPGDVLYVPRGHWHVAKATSVSWSMSIGV
jgi:50S ribosomal protein L16 3-hydroxylase